MNRLAFNILWWATQFRIIAQLQKEQNPLGVELRQELARIRHVVHSAKWTRANRARSNAAKNASHHRRMKANPAYRIEKNTRNRIWWALRAQGAKKAGRTLEILGVKSQKEFFDIQLAKCPPGWDMSNYGLVWELDHIIPCARFDLTKPEQLKRCFHHSNYQPLSVHDNRSKGAKHVSR